MRSQAEIVSRLEARWRFDLFGFETGEYVGALDYSNARPYLKPDVTEDDWTPSFRTGADVLETMKDYAAFAWDEANNRRGISAWRSLAHYIAWLWLIGDEELAGKLENYDYYGKPQLVMICERLGIDWRSLDDGVWVNEELDEVGTPAEHVLAAKGIAFST